MKKNIVDPRTFVSNFNLKKPKSNLYCLTFDDGLKSQIKIALPILKRKRAFFYTYLNHYHSTKSYELYRYLEIIILLILNFYRFLLFVKVKKNNLEFFLKKKQKLIIKRKKDYPFYSLKKFNLE